MVEKKYPTQETSGKIHRKSRPYRLYQKKVFELLKETRQPYYPKEIMEALDKRKAQEKIKSEDQMDEELISLNTDYNNGSARKSLQNALIVLKYIGTIIQLRDRKYVIYDYEPLEEKVVNVLKTWSEKFKDEPYEQPLSLEELMHLLGKSQINMNKKVMVEELALKYNWLPDSFQKLRIEHSNKHLRPILEEWLSNLNNIPASITWRDPLENLSLLGTVGFGGDQKIYKSPPFEPTKIDLLRQHLKYSSHGRELIEEWVDIQEEAEKHIENVYNITKGLGSRFEKIGGPKFQLRNVVTMIYLRLKGENISDPIVEKSNLGYSVLIKNVDSITSSSDLVGVLQSQKKEEIDQFQKILVEELNSSENISKIKDAFKERVRLLKERIGPFKEKIKKIIDKLDSGYYINGSCDECKDELWQTGFKLRR